MRRRRSLATAVGLVLAVLITAGCPAAVPLTAALGRIVLKIGTRVVIQEGASYLRKRLDGNITADPTIVVNYTDANHTPIAEVYQVEGAKGVSIADTLKGNLTVTGDGAGRVTITVPAGTTAEVAITVDTEGAAPSQICAWAPTDGANGSNVKDVGTPPPSVPNVGTATLTMDTNLGVIRATVDLAKVPCTGGALTYLASKKFWDNTKCHRLVTVGIKVLQCGDPTVTGKGWQESDGTGGPGFQYPEENLPVNAKPTYPKSVIAMAKTTAPHTTGSQFFIVYEDTDLPAEYTVLGTITKGLDIVAGVARAGSDNSNGQGDGHPHKEITVNTLTMAAT